VAVGLALVAGAVVVAVDGSAGGPGSTLTHPAPVRSGVVPTAGPALEPGKGTLPGVLPVRLSIPSIGVNATVDGVTVGSDGSLGVPADPATVGWWSNGPLPGASTGTAVLDSHVNYAGQPGAFAQLEALKPGQTIDVIGATSSQTFVVTGLREYAKEQLPWASVFSGKVGGRLALVTCGGPFDSATGHYEDNIVAYAVPSPSTS
jgi:hypothetical protein